MVGADGVGVGGVETWLSLKSTTIAIYDVVYECVGQKNKAHRSLDHDSLARLARLARWLPAVLAEVLTCSTT